MSDLLVESGLRRQPVRELKAAVLSRALQESLYTIAIKAPTIILRRC